MIRRPILERGTRNAADFLALEGQWFDAAAPVSCTHRTEPEIALIAGSIGELILSAKAAHRLAAQ
jgi:hypothetical protein